jgi:hypothetical protein
MPDDLFPALEKALAEEPPESALDLLIERMRAGGQYNLMFEARLMRARLALGLPIVQTEPTSSYPAEIRPVYENAVVEAAREAGQLYLAAGDIESGYRYLRAIGELEPVAAAIEGAEFPEENASGLDAAIAIAFQEGVHPVRGLELILRHHGMCRAITSFGMYAVPRDRERCIALLVRALHAEVVERMSRAIGEQEGAPPETTSLPALMEGRDWLFGEYNCYVDTSHLTSVIPYALETSDEESLSLLGELCAYGSRLADMFRFAGQPPFEDGYAGYGAFIAGDDAYFRRLLSDSPEAAPVLINLLVRQKRFADALEVYVEFLRDEDPTVLRCPGALQLCHMAGDYARMRELARDRGDALSFAAASILSR